jgi:hypothetical protein
LNTYLFTIQYDGISRGHNSSHPRTGPARRARARAAMQMLLEPRWSSEGAASYAMAAPGRAVSTQATPRTRGARPLCTPEENRLGRPRLGRTRARRAAMQAGRAGSNHATLGPSRTHRAPWPKALHAPCRGHRGMTAPRTPRACASGLVGVSRRAGLPRRGAHAGAARPRRSRAGAARPSRGRARAGTALGAGAGARRRDRREGGGWRGLPRRRQLFQARRVRRGREPGQGGSGGGIGGGRP